MNYSQTCLKAVLMMGTSPHDGHQSFGPRPVYFFSFYFALPVYKNKFKNLIRTSKFKFSFQGLLKGTSIYQITVSYFP